MTLLEGFRGVPGVTIRLMSDEEFTRLEVLRDLGLSAVDDRGGAASRA
jgi:hypothetical protein